MIRLRLQRKGRKKRPYFHIVAADQRAPRDGRIIERLGRFDNVSEKKELILDEERVIHWLRIGAQPTDTVRSLLKREGILYKMHLLRWGKSEEEIEQALAEWKASRTESDKEKEVSRKVRQKALLESEEKEYKKQLEEKAAEAARQSKAAKEEASQAEEVAAEEVAEAPEAAVEEAPQEVEAVAAESEAPASEEAPTAEPAEEAIEEKAEAEVVAEAPEAEPAEAEEEAPQDVAAEPGQTETPADKAEATSGKVSTDMTANDAIDHIKNTPLDQLKGFVTESEERVTVQRAWEARQAE